MKEELRAESQRIKNWNSECKGWELSEGMALAFLSVWLWNRSDKVHSGTPWILLLVFTTLLIAFLDLELRLPNQQRREKDRTASVYDL